MMQPVAHLIVVLFLIVTPLTAAQTGVAPLQADFRELGFGMFIHYNMATYH